MDIKNIASRITPEQITEEPKADPTPTDLPQGIIGVQNTIEQGGTANFFDALNNQDTAGVMGSIKGANPDQVDWGKVPIPTEGNANNQGSVGLEVLGTDIASFGDPWQVYEELCSKIKDLINSLPEDLQASMKSKFDDLMKQIDVLINGPEQDIPSPQPGFAGISLPGPLPEIPSEVFHLLNQFVAELQAAVPPA